jgi:hypothetical protein
VDEGDSLKHGKQSDTWSCGLFVENTFAHDLFGDPILETKDCRLQRLQYFAQIVRAQSEQVGIILGGN